MSVNMESEFHDDDTVAFRHVAKQRTQKKQLYNNRC
jgi:hypothetical protein